MHKSSTFLPSRYFTEQRTFTSAILFTFCRMLLLSMRAGYSKAGLLSVIYSVFVLRSMSTDIRSVFLKVDMGTLKYRDMDVGICLDR